MWEERDLSYNHNHLHVIIIIIVSVKWLRPLFIKMLKVVDLDNGYLTNIMQDLAKH